MSALNVTTITSRQAARRTAQRGRAKGNIYQDGEEGVHVAPDGAEDPLLLDRRDEDAGEHAEREDQIAQRHAKHQSARKIRNY